MSYPKSKSMLRNTVSLIGRYDDGDEVDDSGWTGGWVRTKYTLT
jgi:hypothetical protein